MAWIPLNIRKAKCRVTESEGWVLGMTSLTPPCPHPRPLEHSLSLTHGHPSGAELPHCSWAGSIHHWLSAAQPGVAPGPPSSRLSRGHFLWGQLTPPHLGTQVLEVS
jgi:hypothetical protein